MLYVQGIPFPNGKRTYCSSFSASSVDFCATKSSDIEILEGLKGEKISKSETVCVQCSYHRNFQSEINLLFGCLLEIRK